MAADFTTTLNVTGTKEECLQILLVLHPHTNSLLERTELREDWYLEGSLTSPSETTIDELYHDGEMKLSYGGPYGSFTDFLFDQFDLFERIADVAPHSRFHGEISGWDNGGETKITAELRNELLQIRQVFHPDGEPADHETVQTRTYDPINHVYLGKPTGKANISLTFSIYDTKGAKRNLTLMDDDIFGNLTLHCYPEDLLAAKDIDSLSALLGSSVWTNYSETETEAYKQQITDFCKQLIHETPDFSITMLEIHRALNCDDSFLFDWLRSDEYPKIEKLSKSICTGTNQTRQKDVAELEKYLGTEEFWFPGVDEWPEWPELCRNHCEKIQNGFRLIRDPNHRHGGKLNWRGVADSLEAFAEYICSEEEPAEYAVESVIVDYRSGTTRISALYVPGGPEIKPGQSNETVPRKREENQSAQAIKESCQGLTFAYEGRMKIFKNKQAFAYYVEKNGGKATTTVSKRANYFVTNEKSSDNSIKAKHFGISVISEKEFVKRFGSH